MSIQYDGIGHINLVCSKPIETLRFYTEILGFSKKFELSGEYAGGRWFIDYVEIKKGQLLELLHGDFTSDNRDTKRSFQHFCFEMDDFCKTIRELQKRGVTVYRGPARSADTCQEPLEEYHPGLCGSMCAFIIDPEGNDIEIMQYTPQSRQLQK